ncbi:MAG TPA: phospholipase D-like domain-containing protein [bacterium]
MSEDQAPPAAAPATRLRLLGDGREAFAALSAAIDHARSHVFLEMYIFAADATGRGLLARLVAAARRGVRVMVLVDAFGSWATPDAFWEPLRAAGARLRFFRPIRRGFLPFRNHRKLVLVDDAIAWLGGMNIADEYRGGRGGQKPWRDFVLVVEGPDAARLRRQFLRMWALAERPLAWRALFPGRPRCDEGGERERVRFFASGPGQGGRLALQVHRELIRSAAGRVDLAMGYFFPPGRILRELRRAIGRGARVRVLVARHSDVPVMRWAARGLYGRLLRMGVEVFEYLPSMLHAKLAVTDDTVVVGSANLDLRSDRLNQEIVAIVRDPAIAAEARRQFEADLGQAERVALAAWRGRPLLDRLRERVSYWLIARADLLLSRLEIMRTRW